MSRTRAALGKKRGSRRGTAKNDEKSGLREIKPIAAPDYAKTAKEILLGTATLHKALGDKMRPRGFLNDAAACYRNALTLAPDYADAFEALVAVLREKGEIDEEAPSFERVAGFDPKSPMVMHLRAGTTGENVPDRASDAYVTQLFDAFSHKFDDVLEKLKYSAPQRLAKLVEADLGSRRGLFDILDVGCGTGLAGPFLRQIANELVGVDISEGMLEKARERGCYDNLHRSELTAFLWSKEARWDVIMSSDVLCYFGDLSSFAQAAFAAARPDARLAFSLERMPGSGAPFMLQASGRYCHAEDYVRDVVAAAGFVIAQCAHRSYRMEKGKPVPGLEVLARKAP